MQKKTKNYTAKMGGPLECSLKFSCADRVSCHARHLSPFLILLSPLMFSPPPPHPEQLLEFMHQLPAFANMTMSVRRDLCTVMVFEVVEQAGTTILKDKQEVRGHRQNTHLPDQPLHLTTPGSFP